MQAEVRDIATALLTWAAVVALAFGGFCAQLLQGGWFL